MSSVFGFNAEDIDDVYTLNFLEPAFFKYLLQVCWLFFIRTSRIKIAKNLEKTKNNPSLRINGTRYNYKHRAISEIYWFF